MSDATSTNSAPDRRWLILGVIGLAQLGLDLEDSIAGASSLPFGRLCGRSMNGLASSVPAVRVEGVVKRFGETVALDGAGLEVPAGMVFGLLGPNGAGKTTLIRILATLLAPDAGRAEVLGHDVVREPDTVRELIGLTGQFAAVDEC